MAILTPADYVQRTIEIEPSDSNYVMKEILESLREIADTVFGEGVAIVTDSPVVLLLIPHNFFARNSLDAKLHEFEHRIKDL